MSANSPDFDPYHKWLGIPKGKRPPTYYELLAISLDEVDPEVIRGAVQQRRQFVESRRGQGQDAAVNSLIYQLSEAEVTLLKSELRRDYDRRLNLFHRRRKKRQIDPNVSRTRYESRAGKSVGEGSGITGTFFCVMTIFIVGFGMMAWISFQLPWSRLTSADSALAKAAPNPTSDAVESAPLNPEHFNSPKLNPAPPVPVENMPVEQAAVRPVPAPVPTTPVIDEVTANAVDRKAAEWVLGKQGKVKVRFKDGNEVEVQQLANLPEGDFVLFAVNLRDRKEVRDDDLKQLSPLRRLEALNIWGTSVSDNCLAHFSEITSLRDLRIVGTPISGAGFKYLKKLDKLHTILCGGCPIIDPGLDYLAELPGLTFLGLVDTRVTDAGMSALAKVPNLEQLSISGNRGVTNAGLEALAGSRSLKKIGARRTSVTREAVGKFKTRLPECEVEVD